MLVIRFKNYPTRIQMTESRRAKYYHNLSDLPSNWNRKNFYKKGSYIYRRKDHERVIKNRSVVGKPRYETLSGNKFWSGYGHPSTRARIARELKALLRETMTTEGNLSPEDYPLKVSWSISKPITNETQEFDASNLWFYYKMIEDLLVDEGILPDDNFRFISWPSGPMLRSCENEEDREIVVTLEPDPRWNPQIRPPWEPKKSTFSKEDTSS
jgi:hypothetical protein